jgi:hypothetical protein
VENYIISSTRKVIKTRRKEKVKKKKNSKWKRNTNIITRNSALTDLSNIITS